MQRLELSSFRSQLIHIKYLSSHCFCMAECVFEQTKLFTALWTSTLGKIVRIIEKTVVCFFFLRQSSALCYLNVIVERELMRKTVRITTKISLVRKPEKVISSGISRLFSLSWFDYMRDYMNKFSCLFFFSPRLELDISEMNDDRNESRLNELRAVKLQAVIMGME